MLGCICEAVGTLGQGSCFSVRAAPASSERKLERGGGGVRVVDAKRAVEKTVGGQCLAGKDRLKGRWRWGEAVGRADSHL